MGLPISDILDINHVTFVTIISVIGKSRRCHKNSKA